MALVEGKTVLETTNVFREGDIKCKAMKVDDSSSSSSPSPPKPLLIYTPIVGGQYPVILFCHGFYLRNSFYSHLLNHIASHGYILVAPQIYEWVPMLGICEVKAAGEVADWIAQKLETVLPENVKPNLDEFVMAGHSRGGKAAFAVALGYAQTKLKISALVGIDPVAGTGKCSISRTSPHILKGYAGAFQLTMPVIIIGTGLGPQKAHCCTIPCAPDGVNHKEFFFESNPPCAYFVTKDYGHMDMLDDNPEGVVGELSNCMCKNGTDPRDLMRKTVGGLVVAFLRAHLNANTKDLDAILANPSLAPTTLDPLHYVTA
ncbi:chlorophyllase-1 [Senna tora]|uniref:Chlorophyllase-1 n=1 Tax=Senna tora TaxID=362788 RepID=A0A834W0E8_9FABA|nr:chlorophyllase-1 [Senna tora]